MCWEVWSALVLKPIGLIIKASISKVSQKLHPKRINELAIYLLKDEAISGKLILGATVLALLVTDSTLGHIYDEIWHSTLKIGIGDISITKDLRHWIDEGLMAFFFLVVGLELKRELVQGELRKFKTAILPVAAALGGMIVPALLYMGINAGSPGFDGWAIPMATDIAFAVAILAFVGKGIPSSIRLFLLTLAIVDDIGAIIVIAIFYNAGLHLTPLIIAGLLTIGLLLLAKWKWLSMPVFIAVGIGLWLAIDASGVHASIAGALLGFLAPLSVSRSGKKSISERAEHFAIPLSTLLVVPLFAFANTGVSLSLDGFKQPGASQIAFGIVIGLVIGKVVGIVGASWLMVRSNFAELPNKASWSHIIGVGLLAGIGFTVSIFVTELAFTQEASIDLAKLSIFIASAVSAILGIFVLKMSARKV